MSSGSAGYRSQSQKSKAEPRDSLSWVDTRPSILSVDLPDQVHRLGVTIDDWPDSESLLHYHSALVRMLSHVAESSDDAGLRVVRELLPFEEAVEHLCDEGCPPFVKCSFAMFAREVHIELSESVEKVVGSESFWRLVFVWKQQVGPLSYFFSRSLSQMDS